MFHISTFTFLCTSLALLLLLVYLLLIYMMFRKASALNFYTYESAWMKPSEAKEPYYQRILLQQLCLAGLAALCFVVVWAVGASTQAFLLQLSFLLPFLVANSYYFIKNEYNKKEAHASFFKVNKWLILFYGLTIAGLLSSLYILLYKTIDFHVADGFIIVLVFVVPFLAKASASLQKSLPKRFRGRYLNYYTTLILVCILLISVVPAFGFFSYALRKETQTQLKARQFHAAKQIEGRRDALNQYIERTKLHLQADNDTGAVPYIIRRKLTPGYGIYLESSDKLETTLNAALPDTGRLSPAHFYQAITRFLFLPKDHADFFNDNNAYHWQKDTGGKRSIRLHYNNETDHKTAEAVTITSRMERLPVLRSLVTTYTGGFVIVCTLTFFVLLYQLIKALARKIFLLEYFNFNGEKEPGQSWVEEFYHRLTLSPEEKVFLGAQRASLTNQIILGKESKFKPGSQEGAEQILRVQHLLTTAYEAIWKSLKSDEKFILYDFALDGFTNYKNVDILYRLYHKGLIRKQDSQLELMNYSFRNYLLGKAGTEEIMQLEQELRFGSSWKTVKNVFYISFFAVMILLFTTQQDVSNKIIAIVSGLATLVPLLIRSFDANLAAGGLKDKK